MANGNNGDKAIKDMNLSEVQEYLAELAVQYNKEEKSGKLSEETKENMRIAKGREEYLINQDSLAKSLANLDRVLNVSARIAKDLIAEYFAQAGKKESFPPIEVRTEEDKKTISAYNNKNGEITLLRRMLDNPDTSDAIKTILPSEIERMEGDLAKLEPAYNAAIAKPESLDVMPDSQKKEVATLFVDAPNALTEAAVYMTTGKTAASVQKSRPRGRNVEEGYKTLLANMQEKYM